MLEDWRVSEDPIRFVAGTDFYAYVRNNSVNFIDPFGFKDGSWYDWWIWDHVPYLSKVKCAIWGGYCGKVALDKRRNQLAHPEMSVTFSDDELANPQDVEKQNFHKYLGNDDNCDRFLKDCGGETLAPISDGMFPK
jgi:hypothetical protein